MFTKRPFFLVQFDLLSMIEYIDKICGISRQRKTTNKRSKKTHSHIQMPVEKKIQSEVETLYECLIFSSTIFTI